MGNKHPLSLKLKNLGNWSKILYNFSEKNVEIVSDKLIKNYFQNSIISKPIYIYKYNLIKIVFYIYTKKQNIQLNRLIFILNKLFKHQIHLKPIFIYTPYLNTNILAQYIAINLRKYTIQKIWKILIYNMKLSLYIPTKLPKIKNYNILKKELLYNINFIPKCYIVGIKLIINGRFINKNSRSKRLIFNKGSFNSILYNIEYTSIKLYGGTNIKIILSTITK